MAYVLCVSENRHVVGVVSRAVLPVHVEGVPEQCWRDSLSQHPEKPQVCVVDIPRLVDRAHSLGAAGTVSTDLISAMVHRGVPVVVILPVPDVARAAAVMRAGACDCLSLPLRGDQVSASVARALLTGNRMSEPEPGSSRGGTRVSAVDSLLTRYAASDVPVFISGESGVGKDVAARAIHERSARAGGPFVARNCAAIPESLFETELFGSEPGAYTGAVRRAGAFELAAGGTIFLDEIADLSPSKQAALLRVLEDQSVRRIGGRTATRLSFRLITATNRRLAAEVEEGRFRRDLYFRIRVLSVRIPPLRERRDDIPALCRTFSSLHGNGNIQFLPGALAMLQEQPWPGNVRQLRNVVQRLCVLSESNVITGDLVRFALTMPD